MATRTAPSTGSLRWPWLFYQPKMGGDFNGFTSEHAPGMVIIGDSWIGLGPNRRGIGNFKGPVGMMTIWGWENMFTPAQGPQNLVYVMFNI